MPDKKLKIVFIGTARFAVPVLHELVRAGYDIRLVITQPDRPKGRGKALSPPPVKEALMKSDLVMVKERLFQPENINSDDAVKTIAGVAPDFIVVVAYGQLLKKRVLDIPGFGCINVHASLLPGLRGAAPINRAIMNGDRITGVTTMMMDEGMDTGDILMKTKTDIDDTIDSIALAKRLSDLGATLLVRTIEGVTGGSIVPAAQDEMLATYAHILTKSDGLILFDIMDAKDIHNMVRGLLPWPAAHTVLNGRPVKILKTDYDMDEDTRGAAPGTVTMVTKASFFIAAKKGVLKVLELQPENKKVMPAKDFINGYRLKEGAVFA